MSLACVNLHMRSNIVPLCDITEYTAYLFKYKHYNTLSIINIDFLKKPFFPPVCTYSITDARVESDEVNDAAAMNVLSIWIIQSSHRICIRAHFIYFWSKSMTRVHPFPPRAVLESWKWCW